MKYLVTGATGFIGRWVARKLVEQGHEVRSLARNPEKSRHLGETGVDMMQGEITRKESMREAMLGVDGVFHTAEWHKLGVLTKAEIAAAEAINVGGTRNVLEMVRELKIPRCVYTSSLAIFTDTGGKLFNETYHPRGPWASVYAQTKWKAHYEVVQKMQEERVPVIIVQPGLVYGPGDASGLHEMWVAYLQKNLSMVPQKTAFCWGHVEDIAQGHLDAMWKGKSGESYILAGPPHTLVEAFEIAEKITGIKPPKFHPGAGLVQSFAAVKGVTGYLKPQVESESGEWLKTIAGKTYLGTDQKARLELDFLPRSLETGLRETLAFEQAELKRLTTVYVSPKKQPSEFAEGASEAIGFLKSKVKKQKLE